MPLESIGQLPLAVLSCWSWAFGTHAAVDHTGVTLPIAVGIIIVRVGVGCTCTGLEKGRSRSVRNPLFWVIANGAGTLVAACVAIVEELWRRKSVCKDGKKIRTRK